MLLQDNLIYGPITSRRFGTSLGINLLPAEVKLCTFDCGYCQYEGGLSARPVAFPDLKQIRSELSGYLSALGRGKGGHIDWIMIAGNGEPTLHPQFPQAVAAVLEARDRWLPAVPVGILSNSSTCARPETRRALALLNDRFMKLDAGSDELFQRINRPSGSQRIGSIVKDLCALAKQCEIVIQSMFVEGAVSNTGDEAVSDWIAALRVMMPASVHLYSLDRQPQDPGIRTVPAEKLNAIAARLRAVSEIPTTVY